MALPGEEDQSNELTPSADQDSDFSAAFSERASGSVVEEQRPEEKPSGSQDQDAAPKPASEAASDQPAAQPGSPADPWEGLSPEQLDYFKRIQHSEQSQRGRVASLTKKLNSSQQPPAQAAPKQEQQSDEGDGDKDKGQHSAAEVLENRLKQAAEDYPDAVGPLADVIQSIRSEIADLSKKVQPISEDRDAETITKEYANLEKAHPDYRELGEDQSFQNWVKDQPKSVIAMANSWDAKEVSLALTLFKTERDAAIRTHEEPGAQQKSATDTRRERQLEATKVIPNKGVPAASGVPDDFASAFKARAAAHKR